MSSMFEAMGALNNACPFESLDSSSYGIDPQPTSSWGDNLYGPDTSTFVDRWNAYNSQPRYIPNIDGFIDPFVSGMWNSPTTTIENLYDRQMFGGQEKIDPNRIFSSDLASLKKIAADQAKLISVFERKAMEMYTDKGQFGLNEDAIAAMQAVTSARNILLAIAKEQAGIKKNITELKIKQQAAGEAPSSGGPTGGRTASVFDVGRDVMNNIFNMPDAASEPVMANYPSVSINEASSVLESIVSSDSVPDSVKFEQNKPTTYVVVGENDNDYEFKTYDAAGEEMPDYPVPDVKIPEGNIDRESMRATDELLVSYPLKFRNE
ncbi:MAG: hypothetical protein J5614_08285 [Paludibacteraceae bacterium]|nr:hypothetical protein [Paludibacteraceae bacterium]